MLQLRPNCEHRDHEYSLYMLRCADGSLYTGIAVDVKKRIAEHENGSRGAKYLRGRGPLRLVFEQCLGNRATASRVEYRVKQLDRSQKEALVDGQTTLGDILSDPGCDADQASGAACR
ncbi:MAG: GIY-YIG nuclease family protein [Proteobacteria bacterium]|nr:GIY-YIG nuclease family protein [Pseudomonadota bacterium]